MDKVLKEILSRITPTPEEHAEEQQIVADISRRIEKFGVKPILVGSLAKGTDVRDSKDIDIFVLFHKDVPREELEKKGLEIGRKVFSDLKLKTEIDYAEHPYIKGYMGKYVLEIVPCYDTKEIKSAVDRTPYHTHYIKKKFLEKPELRGEVRLLKQFMKGTGVYGAEAKVEGFSGYLTELLVINYGSFPKVLEATAKWDFGEAIDPEKLWDNKDALKYFFPNADLIIVDPVDKNRNAAAAVSKQKLSELIVAARDFLEKPSAGFFFPNEDKAISASELRKRMKMRGTKILGMKLVHKKINENTLHSQLRKTIKSVSSDIDKEGFRVMKTGYWTDEEETSMVLFELEVFELPRIKRRNGPPVNKALSEQKKFLKKYEGCRPYIEGDHWVADIERTYCKATDLMQGIIKEKKGFGKNLTEAKKITILEDEEILKNKDKDYQKFLSCFFTPCA